jgi:hypothetical protein
MGLDLDFIVLGRLVDDAYVADVAFYLGFLVLALLVRHLSLLLRPLRLLTS